MAIFPKWLGQTNTTLIPQPGQQGIVGTNTANAINANAINAGTIMAQSGWPKSDDELLLEMIACRMRWNTDVFGAGLKYNTPFKTVVASRLDDETVAVFIVINGKAVVLEDSAGLFPSDTLITQLRLLEGGK